VHPNCDDIVALYDPAVDKNKDLERKVILKRVHSCGYHHCRDYYRKRWPAMLKETTNMKAQHFAIKCSDAWIAKYPVA
jgi:hypothetical protein